MTSLRQQLLGPASKLVPYFESPIVSDILINGTWALYIEQEGLVHALPSPFQTNDEIFHLIERLVVPIGKRIDAAAPYIDGHLVDGSRFHIILPPLASNGPFISIRKFVPKESRDKSINFNAPDAFSWLKTQVEQRRNILIAGGTGVGKTTLLSMLLETVHETERIAVIEETREIQLNHPHVLYLESRAPSTEGRGEVTVRTLIRNTLRMRPNRIVIGECRGEEVFDMLQAMNTGHPGSFCSVHASSALDALKRLESLALLSGFALPLSAIREWIASAIHIVVFLDRHHNQRKIREIITVQGLERDVYRFSPVFPAPSLKILRQG